MTLVFLGCFLRARAIWMLARSCPPGGMQDYLKWVVLVLPYPAQDLFGILLIYELVGRQSE